MTAEQQGHRPWRIGLDLRCGECNRPWPCAEAAPDAPAGPRIIDGEINGRWVSLGVPSDVVVSEEVEETEFGTQITRRYDDGGVSISVDVEGP